jgi:hypothetical protein
VYLDGNEYKQIPNGKAEIIESEFEYTSDQGNQSFNWNNIFKIRAIGVGSINLIPNNGNMLLGLGAQFIQWKGMGLNSHIAFDFKNIAQSEPRVGIGYSPNIYDLDLNLAIGLSIGTPIIDFFNEYSANLDLIFYINN